MVFTMPGKDVPVRLISYLTTHPENAETTYVLGVDENQMLVLRHLARAKDDTTIFFVDSSDIAGIRLYWAKDRSKFVTWSFDKYPCFVTNAARMRTRDASILVTQFAKADPWLNLIDWQRQLFAIDVAASKTDDGSRVLLWNSNGGDNQVWRCEPVKP
jgi:hypothetical protein